MKIGQNYSEQNSKINGRLNETQIQVDGFSLEKYVFEEFVTKHFLRNRNFSSITFYILLFDCISSDVFHYFSAHSNFLLHFSFSFLSLFSMSTRGFEDLRRGLYARSVYHTIFLSNIGFQIAKKTRIRGFSRETHTSAKESPDRNITQ